MWFSRFVEKHAGRTIKTYNEVSKVESVQPFVKYGKNFENNINGGAL